MSRHRQRGFTLVELLVVITIIGILMALIIPAVNMALEAARRAECSNKMKQLASAATQHDTAKQYFPGYNNPLKTPAATPIAASWTMTLLPYMGELPLYESNESGTAATPYLSMMVCGSDPPNSKDGPYTSYVANAGYVDPANESIATGIMHNRNIPDPSDPNRRTGPRITATQITDGPGSTLLITENLQQPNGAPRSWAATDKYSNCFVWQATDDPQWRINGNKRYDNPASPPAAATARPSSSHNSAVNVAFCDARTGSLRQDMDYHVLVQLMTPQHTKIPTAIASGLPTTPVDWKTYILQDKDYQ